MSKHVDELIRMMDERPTAFVPMAAPNHKTVWGSTPNDGLSMSGGTLMIWKNSVITTLMYNRVEIPLTWLDKIRIR